MKQELDQIAPTISDNPFMKNDIKKKPPSMRQIVAIDATEINNNDNEELSLLQHDSYSRERIYHDFVNVIDFVTIYVE